MNELFANWLHSGDKGLLRLVLPRETYLFLRAEKQPGFDYLYCQRQYSSDGLRRKDSFQYAGLYCAADGLIYDADYALTHMDGADKTLPARSYEALRRQLQQDVRAMIEQRVADDRGNLTVHELTDEKFLCALDAYRKYYAARDVRQRYLETGELDSDGFHCRYVPEGWTEDSFLSRRSAGLCRAGGGALLVGKSGSNVPAISGAGRTGRRAGCDCGESAKSRSHRPADHGRHEHQRCENRECDRAEGWERTDLQDGDRRPAPGLHGRLFALAYDCSRPAQIFRMLWPERRIQAGGNSPHHLWPQRIV